MYMTPRLLPLAAAFALAPAAPLAAADSAPLAACRAGDDSACDAACAAGRAEACWIVEDHAAACALGLAAACEITAAEGLVERQILFADPDATAQLVARCRRGEAPSCDRLAIAWTPQAQSWFEAGAGGGRFWHGPPPNALYWLDLAARARAKACAGPKPDRYRCPDLDRRTGKAR